MSAPTNSTATPSHGMSAIAALLMVPEGRHRVDPRNPEQWRAAVLVAERQAREAVAR